MDKDDLEEALVSRWAPIHYQSVGSRNPSADLLAAVDYDGSWDMRRKWRNLNNFPLVPHVYYSLVETRTHWYIIYAFYHPRDWDPLGIPFFEHENDMEGCLMIVEKKEGFRYGYLHGMITVSHGNFWTYSLEGRLNGERQTRDGRPISAVDGAILATKLREVYHPALYQDPYGHGLWAWDGGPFRGEYLEYRKRLTTVMAGLVAKLTFVSEANQGVRYYPGETTREPPYPYRAAIGQMDVPYKLVSLFEEGGLWQRRGQREVYTTSGAFQGNYPPIIGKDRVKPPWGWGEKDEKGDLSLGMIATDPAQLVQRYFCGFSPDFDRTYVRNEYLSDRQSRDELPQSAVPIEAALDLSGPGADQAFAGPFNPPIECQNIG